MQQIILTKTGAGRLQEKITALEKHLKDVPFAKGDAASTGGNVWHGNFSFEELLRQEAMLAKQVADLRAVRAYTTCFQQVNPDTRNTFRNAKSRIVVIPDHGSQVIVRPRLRKILRDLGLSVEAHTRLLGEQ